MSKVKQSGKYSSFHQSNFKFQAHISVFGYLILSQNSTSTPQIMPNPHQFIIDTSTSTPQIMSKPHQFIIDTLKWLVKTSE